MDQMFIQCLLHADKNALLLRFNHGKARARMIRHATKELQICLYCLKFFIKQRQFKFWNFVSRSVMSKKKAGNGRDEAGHQTTCILEFAAKINGSFSTIKQRKWNSSMLICWVADQMSPWTPPLAPPLCRQSMLQLLLLSSGFGFLECLYKSRAQHLCDAHWV